MEIPGLHEFGIPTARALPGHRALLRLLSPLVLCMLNVISAPLWAQRSPDVDDRFRQATEAMRKGKLEEAGEGLAAVVSRAPTFAEAHLNLGLVREEQGRHEEAIGSFQKALGLKPSLH